MITGPVDPNTTETIAQAVELAIAPIFLLVAMGSLLNVMTQRLGRVVDRARALEQQIDQATHTRQQHRQELVILEGRMVSSNRAIAACVFSSVLVCVMVAVFFCGALFGWPVTLPIAILFLVVMVALSLGLCFFLYEILLSGRSLRVRSELLRQRDEDEG